MKRFIIIMAIFWSVIAVALTGLLIFNVNNPGKRIVENTSSGTQTYNDESFSTSNITRLQINLPSEDVQVFSSDSNDIRVVHRGWGLEDADMLILGENGNTLNIQRQNMIRSNWFNFGFNRASYVDIYLPADYIPELNVQLSSGTLTFTQDFAFTDLSLRLSSGDIFSNSKLTADSATFQLSSGSVTLSNLDTARYQFNLSSGDVLVRNLSGAGTVDMTSGTFRADSAAMKGDVRLKCTSGDVNFNLAGDPNLNFTAHLTSGDIRTYFDLTYHDKYGRDVSAKMGSEPYYNLDIQVTSGNINIDKA